MPIFRKPSILPPGMYDVQIISAKARKSKTGNDMIVVTAEVSWEGKTHSIRDYLVLDGAANWKFESFAYAIGEAIADGEAVEPDDYVGGVARVVLGIEQFEGRQQNKIKKWMPANPTPCSETKPEEEVHSNGATS